MADSHVQHLGIRLWERILKALLGYRVGSNQRETAAASIHTVLNNINRNVDELIFEAYAALSDVENNLQRSVTDPRRLGPHTQLIARLKMVFAPGCLSQDWNSYKGKVISQDMIGSLGLLDADLSGHSLTATDLAMIGQEVQKLQERVRKGNLSPSWTSLLTAQLDLIERAVARVNADGFDNFSEVVFCAVGRLELELKVGKHDADLEVVREIADDVLRIAGLAQLGTGAAAALPFFSKIAGLLTGPGA